MADVYDVAIGWLAGRDDFDDDPTRDQIELAARELAGLDRDDLRTVVQLVRSMRGKDRIKSRV